MARKHLADMQAPRLSPLGTASEETVASEDKAEVAGSAETEKDESRGRPSEPLAKPTEEGEARGLKAGRPEALAGASDGDTKLLPPVEEDPLSEPEGTTEERVTAANQAAESPGASSRAEPPPPLGTPEAVGR